MQAYDWKPGPGDCECSLDVTDTPGPLSVYLCKDADARISELERALRIIAIGAVDATDDDPDALTSGEIRSTAYSALAQGKGEG